ncbi:MAG TPA: PQQ-dependent sugar dehydrogenase, partial [Actinopolymorphaceae bacterium]
SAQPRETQGPDVPTSRRQNERPVVRAKHPMSQVSGVVSAAAAALVLGCGLAACAEEPDGSRPGSGRTNPTETTPAETSPSESAPGRSSAPTASTPRVVSTVASGLTTPWGLVFLPNGDALVSERDTARIKRIDTAGRVTTVGTVPGVVSPEETSEGGLLGLAFADDVVYAYFTSQDDNRIVAMPYDGRRLGAPKVILDGIPQSSIHNGGRLLFGPDGYLYVTTGDGGDGSNSQDPESLGGKILRITTEGAPAPDNPFENSPVWSLGHRNPQGLAFDPQKRLWAAEFGQNEWDEVNLIRPGANYGWPDVEGRSDDPDSFAEPLAVWGTDEASPSGLAYAQGSLWMAALRGERLWRIPLDGASLAGDPTDFFEGEYGRLRTITPAPDGSLWLTESNTDGRGDPEEGSDRILRVELS